jgi:type IV secretion system protein VirB6
MLIVAINNGGGCWLRYNPDADLVHTKSISLRASGKYTDTPCQQDNTCADNTKYGKWLKIDNYLTQGDSLAFTISGNVSLCGAGKYEDSPIPPVDILHEGGLPIILDPQKTKGYVYLANILNGDKIKVVVGKNSSNSQQNVPNTKGNSQVTDCDKGLDGAEKSFHAACNKFSPYIGATFAFQCKTGQSLNHYSKCHDTPDVNLCGSKPEVDDDRCKTPNTSCSCKIPSNDGRNCYKCNKMKYGILNIPGCPPGIYCYDDCFEYNSSCTITTTRPLPDPYLFDKIYLSSDRIFSPQDFMGNNNCSGIPSESQAKSWFAFQAEDANGKNTKTFSGLYYNIVNTDSSNQLSATALEIIEDGPDVSVDKLNGSAPRTLDTRVIFDNRVSKLPNGSDTKNYFAVFFQNFQDSTKYTGGYVIYLKHTGCYRENGEYWPTPYKDGDETKYIDKGQIRYLILDNEQDPNKDPFDRRVTQ